MYGGLLPSKEVLLNSEEPGDFASSQPLSFDVKLMSLGYLYIVSTSIGNLEEVTLRALRVLKEADFTAADLRHSSKLLNYHGIRKPLISYRSQKEKVRSASGLSTEEFTFIGFLPPKAAQRQKRLKKITKIHEEILRGTISEILDILETRTTAVEYVIIVEGKSKKAVSIEEALEEIKSLTKKEKGRKEAVKVVTGIEQKELYNKSLG